MEVIVQDDTTTPLSNMKSKEEFAILNKLFNTDQLGKGQDYDGNYESDIVYYYQYDRFRKRHKLMMLKRICEIQCIFLMAFLVGCSSQENPTIESADDSDYITERLQEEYVSEEALVIKSEKLTFPTNYTIKGREGIYLIGDYLFYGNTGYEYKDGAYHLSEKKLTDYLPKEDQEVVASYLENGHYDIVWQSNQTIIYANKASAGEKQITVLEVPSGEIKGTFFVDGWLKGIYEEKLYYCTAQLDDAGQAYYAAEYIDCNDFSRHVVFCSADNKVVQILVREDGAIAFLVANEGYYIADKEGNVRLLHENLEGRLWYALEMFHRFDYTGLYFWIEYDDYPMQYMNVTEDGKVYRIRQWQGDSYRFLNQGVLVYDGNKAYLYPNQYETAEAGKHWHHEDRVWEPLLAEYEILDDSYWEKGYRLDRYFYEDDIMWWFWKNNKDELIVTKTFFE